MTSRFGSDWWTRFRTPEDKAADEIRRRHEDNEADCVEDCPLCLEENEPVSLCCGEPALENEICSHCFEHALFKPRVKGF